MDFTVYCSAMVENSDGHRWQQLNLLKMSRMMILHAGLQLSRFANQPFHSHCYIIHLGLVN